MKNIIFFFFVMCDRNVLLFVGTHKQLRKQIRSTTRIRTVSTSQRHVLPSKGYYENDSVKLYCKFLRELIKPSGTKVDMVTNRRHKKLFP